MMSILAKGLRAINRYDGMVGERLLLLFVSRNLRFYAFGMSRNLITLHAVRSLI